MKNIKNNTNTQQSKKSGSNKWMRWALVAVVLGLLAGDGILNGRWSDITLAGSEDESPVTPSELVMEEVVEEPVAEPAPEPVPEVTESAPVEEKAVPEAAVEAAPAAQAEEEKEEIEQDGENKEQTEQDVALAEDAQTEELALEAEAQPAVERSVTIHSSLEDNIAMDETFSMTAELAGFEGTTYQVQWQRNEGFEWEDIEGANDLVLELPASALSTEVGYRLVVTVDE